MMTAAISSAAAPTCRLGTASGFLNIVPARPLLQIGVIAPDGVVAPEGLVGRVDPAEVRALGGVLGDQLVPGALHGGDDLGRPPRSEEHTSELQSLMRISYAFFCLKKKNTHKDEHA